MQYSYSRIVGEYIAIIYKTQKQKAPVQVLFTRKEK